MAEKVDGEDSDLWIIPKNLVQRNGRNHGVPRVCKGNDSYSCSGSCREPSGIIAGKWRSIFQFDIGSFILLG